MLKVIFFFPINQCLDTEQDDTISFLMRSLSGNKNILKKKKKLRFVENVITVGCMGHNLFFWKLPCFVLKYSVLVLF